MINHVAIVGGGFSGALQAIDLLRHDGPRVTLIERSRSVGAGLAFGAAHPAHLLNVRAANMSALPDDRNHFVRWLAAEGGGGGHDDFVPRLTYGRYLRALLAETAALANDRLQIVFGDVIDLTEDPSVRLRLADGRIIAADAAVLAIGNLLPHTPRGLDPTRLGVDRYRSDPWAPGLADGLRRDDTVLVLGSGLTMVDVALALDAEGFEGNVIAMSRRGLLPHVHAEVPPFIPLAERPTPRASALLRSVRQRSEAIGWRGAIDSLRPMTQMLWRGASETERKRFLRHLRPYWDIHRHRLAPPVAARIAGLRAEGRLRVVAGELKSAVAIDRGVTVAWRPRGAGHADTMTVARIVNCTGPQGDLSRSDDPLLRNLLTRELIRPDAAHLGIDVDAQARAIAVSGAASERLFAIGPMTRGAFWEIVAVPDIRHQTWSLGRRLSNAHWEGGEGL